MVVGGHDQAYWIDDPTGGVSYSIAARGLNVCWNTEEYWKWILHSLGARFVTIDLGFSKQNFIKKLINQATIHVFHINVKNVNGLIFNYLLTYLMQYNMMHA
jgi:hypothetical protein